MNMVELAQRIKALRLDRKLTLEQVATSAGQTRSWLSKVENFRVTPSLKALSRIAEALGVTVSQLVAGLEERPQIAVVRAHERKLVERDRPYSQIIYESLAHSRPSRSMDPFLLVVPRGESRRELMGHEGEEFLFLLDGAVDLDYNQELFTLRAGDSVYFDANVQHRLLNPYDDDARLLCVFREPGNSGLG